jgi:hypothetical protein
VNVNALLRGATHTASGDAFREILLILIVLDMTVKPAF